MNKPAGVISATEDTRDRTVLDLLDGQQRKGLFPVGRLDRDTEGLLLITNDGELAHRMLSPKNHVDKVYFARLDGPVGETERRLFAEGLRVDETLTAMPARLDVLEPANEVNVTIREGKFHQIKRMFAAVGREVLYLKRLSMGPLVLDGSLAPGTYRRLTEEIRSQIPKCSYRKYTVSEIINGIINAGFILKRFDEHPSWENEKLPGEFTAIAVKE